jgi:hypothetical protein
LRGQNNLQIQRETIAASGHVAAKLMNGDQCKFTPSAVNVLYNNVIVTTDIGISITKTTDRSQRSSLDQSLSGEV